MNLKRKIEILGLEIPIFLIVAALIAAPASAALLNYYGTIGGSADIEQSVTFVEGSTEESFSFNAVSAGETILDSYTLVNNGGSEAGVYFKDTYKKGAGSWTDEEAGITTSYYDILGYSEEFLAEDTHFDNTDVTVEDLGESVKWTLEVPQDAEYGTGRGPGGQVAWSVSIGVEDEILYQVHMNDGTDSSYDNGEYLYSEYDNVWQTGSENTLVSDMNEINASGEYEGGETFTIEISKKKLHPEQFKWVVYANYETDSLPDAFSWGDSDTTNFKEASVGVEIEEEIVDQIGAGESLDFLTVNDFAINIEPDDYSVKTEVKPESELE